MTHLLELAYPALNWVLHNSAAAAGMIVLVLLAQRMAGARVSARWRYNLWLLAIALLLVPPIPGLHLPKLHWPGFERIGVATAPPQANKPAAQSRVVVIHRNAEIIPVARPIEFSPGIERPHPLESLIAASPDAKSLNAQAEMTLAGHFQSTVAASEGFPTWGDSAHPNNWKSRAAAVRTDVAPTPVSRPANRSISWGRIATGTWLAIASALLGRLCWLSARLARSTRKLPPVADPSIHDLLCDCCRMLHVPRIPPLLQAPPDSPPALVGALRPRLLLPTCVLSEFPWRELRLIMLHELLHLKRRDVLMNYLMSLLAALHWFNPLVWLALARMRVDRELACDEAVLRITPWRESRVYGSTIVKLLELLSHGVVPAGAMGVIQHRALIHRRIAMIARFDQNKRTFSAAGALLSLVVCGAAMTGAVLAQDRPGTPPNPQPVSAAPAAEPQPAQPGDAPAVEAARAAVEREATGQPPISERTQAVGEPPADDVSTAPPDPGAAPVIGRPPATVGPVLPFNPRPGQSMGPRGRPGYMNTPAMNTASPTRAGTVEDAAAVEASRKTLEKLRHPFALNVENVSLTEVLNMLADQAKVDILVDNRALNEAGMNYDQPVTLRIRESQPIDELLKLTLRVAGGNELGFSLVHGVVLVSTNAELSQRVITRVYEVGELGSASDVAGALRPALEANADVSLFDSKVIVTASEPNQREVQKLLDLLHEKGATRTAAPSTSNGRAVNDLKVFPLKYAKAPAAANVLKSVFPAPQPGQSRPSVDIGIDERTNSLVITAPVDSLMTIEKILQELDSTPAAAGHGDANVPARGTEARSPAGSPNVP